MHSHDLTLHLLWKTSVFSSSFHKNPSIQNFQKDRFHEFHNFSSTYPFPENYIFWIFSRIGKSNCFEMKTKKKKENWYRHCRVINQYYMAILLKKNREEEMKGEKKARSLP